MGRIRNIYYLFKQERMTTITDNNYLMIGTKATNKWGEFYLTLTGTADFDKYVFDKLANGELTGVQASALWEYTDGYKLTLTSQIQSSAASYSIHCLKKTHSVLTGEYDSGAICFETKWGALENVSFYGGLDADSTSMKISTVSTD